MRVLVAGGGITGLAAAHALVKRGVDVAIAERSQALGGKIATERVDGLLIEHGPDSFLTLRPAGLALSAELGLADEIAAPLAPDTVYVWHGSRLVPIPAGTGFGLPTRFRPFIASPLFSPLEKLRAAMEPMVAVGAGEVDVSIGAFLRRRFGDAAVDRLAGPLISAIYGADVDELSLDALMPRLREAERRHGSLVRAGLAARRTARAPAGPALVTLRRGMASLVEAIVPRLGGTEVMLGAELVRIERAASRYVARFADGSHGDADAIVLATPAPAAARALGHLAPAAADALAGITYRSTVAITLAYEREQLARPLVGHGFVVPDGALPIAACTWSSTKWPGRVADGAVLVRATVRSEDLLARSDAELVAIAGGVLARTIGTRGGPIVSRVTRWPGAMPRYTVGHLERLAHVAAAVQPFPGLILAGAAYRGSGIPDCIAQGQAAAEEITQMEKVAA